MPVHARRRPWAALLLAILSLQGACAWSAEQAGSGRIVAVSDIHGAGAAFRRTLAAAQLVDAAGRWSGGDSVLVVTGDLLDRGDDSRAVMDLLMRLEEEAAAAGGQVQVLLGNHEVMNLVGDLRYVSDGEYAAFAADETTAERDYWYGQFVVRAALAAAGQAEPADDAELRARFDRAHPPGFFAHRRAFRSDGTYGAWLLDKALLTVIDGIAFVHGGISPRVASLGLHGVNETLTGDLRAYVQAVETLTDAGLLQPGDSFYAHRKLLAALPEDPDRADALVQAIATVHSDPATSVHDQDGPLWYRGHVGCSPLVEGPRLEAALAALGATRIVIGHTPTANRAVVTRFGGRVVEIDTGMLGPYYGGSGHALLIDGHELAVVNELGEPQAITVDPALASGGANSGELLETALARGAIELGTARADGTVSVRVGDGESALDAVFYPQPKGGVMPELAAYRLDRALGLYMVPITVAREIGGRSGALQLQPARLSDEARRSAAQAGGDAWCALPRQWASMYLFDVLIYKGGRTPGQILYDASSWRLFLAGHDNAFATRGGRPGYLRRAELDVNSAWRAALEALDAAAIDAALGDVLNDRQRSALLKRRDELLAMD